MSKALAGKATSAAKPVNASARSVTNVPIARGISSTSPTMSDSGKLAFIAHWFLQYAYLFIKTFSAYSPLTPITAMSNKLDPADTELKSLIENNQSWADAVTKEKPNYFKEMSLKQEPKILWIGKDWKKIFISICSGYYLITTCICLGIRLFRFPSSCRTSRSTWSWWNLCSP